MDGEPAQVPLMVWRVTRGGRIGTLAAATLPVLMELAVLGANLTGRSDTARLFVPLGVAPLVGLTVYLAWAFAYRPRIALFADRVTVVNPFRRYEVVLNPSVRAHAGYRGVTIFVMSEGNARTVSAWAAQKANYSAVRKKVTRADEVASAIEGAVAALSIVEQR